MVFKIKILPLAEKEIDESIEFYESRSKDLGKQFLTYLRSYFKVLKTNPELLQEIKTKLDKRNKKKKLIEAISVISFLILMAFALYYLNLIL